MKLTANDVAKMAAMTSDECVAYLRRKVRGSIALRAKRRAASALRGIVKPVHCHPQRLPHTWRSTDEMQDPQRPLEPGEDAAGKLTSYALLKDFARDGRRVFKNIVIAAALLLAIAGGASAQKPAAAVSSAQINAAVSSAKIDAPVAKPGVTLGEPLDKITRIGLAYTIAPAKIAAPPSVARLEWPTRISRPHSGALHVVSMPRVTVRIVPTHTPRSRR
jgi:hypothetical protein